MTWLVVFSAVIARHAIDPMGLVAIMIGGILGFRRVWFVWAIATGIAVGAAVIFVVTGRRTELGLGPSPFAEMIMIAYPVLAIGGFALGNIMRRIVSRRAEL